MAVTVELRGQADVSHELASRDARALLDFLVHRGLVAADSDAPRELPPLLAAPTPLAASEDLKAPHAGVVVFLKRPGDEVAAGEPGAEIVDPVASRTTPVIARYAGRLYARALRRYAGPGDSIAHVAGSVVFRTGNLLSP